MRGIITSISIIFFVFATGHSQNIPVKSFSEFEPLLHKQNDTLYLVNFWASWCVPCVKELPGIDSLATEFKQSKFKVLLVSLDMPNQINSRLKPFLKKHHINAKVVLLNDPDFNSWIDKVDPNWSGSIPATLIYSKTYRKFYEQSFTYGQLKNIIQPKIETK